MADLTPKEREDRIHALRVWLSFGHPLRDGDIQFLFEEIDRLRAATVSAPASLRKLLEQCQGEIQHGKLVEFEEPGLVGRSLTACRDGTCLRCCIDAALAAPVVSVWTSEPPKVPGWYWWKNPEHRGGPHCVRVWKVGPLLYLQDGISPDEYGGEWQGPIEPK